MKQRQMQACALILFLVALVMVAAAHVRAATIEVKMPLTHADSTGGWLQIPLAFERNMHFGYIDSIRFWFMGSGLPCTVRVQFGYIVSPHGWFHGTYDTLRIGTIIAGSDTVADSTWLFDGSTYSLGWNQSFWARFQVSGSKFVEADSMFLWLRSPKR